MADKSKTQEAIQLIDETKTKLIDLFSDNPGMVLRISSVLTSLNNGLKHTIGVGVQPSEMNSSIDREPLKSVFGKKLIKEKGQEPFTPIIHNTPEFQSDVEKLRYEVDQILPTLLDREPSEILNSIEELHLRAIGKSLGIPYENININTEYVKSVQETLVKNKEDEKLREEMKLKADENLEEGSDDQNEAIDHVVSAEDVKNNPELTENGIKVGDEIQIDKKDAIDIDSLSREELSTLHKELFGKEPHHNTKDETIREKIKEFHEKSSQ